MGDCLVVVNLFTRPLGSVIKNPYLYDCQWISPRRVQDNTVLQRVDSSLLYSMGESITQVGVHLLLIFQSSRPLLKTMNPIGCRLRCNPQTNTLNYK